MLANDSIFIGCSDLVTSRLGLGCNNFGMKIAESVAREVVDAALECGITLFDTADVYGGGASEEILGRCLALHRSDVLIATKFGLPLSDRPGDGGASRRYVAAACEASLRRLDVDVIDLLLIHQPDPLTPIEETLEAVDMLIERGKIRYFGVSNFAGWQLADAVHVSAGRRVRPVAVQCEWSLLARQVEAELVPAAVHFGVGIVPYFPLASGLLTGKYRNGNTPPGSRLAELPFFRDVLTPNNLETAARLERWAAERGGSLLDLALSWVVTRPGVSSVLVGATTAEQIRQNVAAAAWRWDEADERELAEILSSREPRGRT